MVRVLAHSDISEAYLLSDSQADQKDTDISEAYLLLDTQAYQKDTDISVAFLLSDTQTDQKDTDVSEAYLLRFDSWHILFRVSYHKGKNPITLLPPTTFL